MQINKIKTQMYKSLADLPYFIQILYNVFLINSFW